MACPIFFGGQPVEMVFIRTAQTFGQPSAGYTSSNGTYRLSNGAILQLANAYAADRKKNIYKKRIYPNVHVRENTRTADDTMQAAMEWVTKEGG